MQTETLAELIARTQAYRDETARLVAAPREERLAALIASGRVRVTQREVLDRGYERSATFASPSDYRTVPCAYLVSETGAFKTTEARDIAYRAAELFATFDLSDADLVEAARAAAKVAA